MDNVKEMLEQLFKAIDKMTPKEHAFFYEEIRSFTKNRMMKEIEVRAVEQKELTEFMNNQKLS